MTIQSGITNTETISECHTQATAIRSLAAISDRRNKAILLRSARNWDRLAGKFEGLDRSWPATPLCVDSKQSYWDMRPR